MSIVVLNHNVFYISNKCYNFYMKKEICPAKNIIENVCKVKKDERVLIIANPETSRIAQELYAASCEAGAKTVLAYQSIKTSFDSAEKEIIAAIASNPDVCISVSAQKLGKDAQATANPYKTEDGCEYQHVFDFLLDGKKSMRAVWTPGITWDMYERTVNIDYENLRKNCELLGKYFENAISVQVTAPSGTDVAIPIYGRKLQYDDGDFSKPGTGGNIPAGEVFISPVVGSGNQQKTLSKVENFVSSILKRENTVSENQGETSESSFGTQGKIVFDGSMTFGDGDSVLNTPIECVVQNGFVTEINGGSEARRLLKTIVEAENKALILESEGKLPQNQGSVYRRNARNIGELGIGLNPAANVTGNMLEDEKAFSTCHFAIGENYDNDAPCLIHLDGVVKNPTITLTYEDGSTRTILENGALRFE